MDRYKVLIQERADLVAEGGKLFAAAEAEGRGLSEAEAARDDAINARLAAIGTELEREERRRERERTVAALPLPGGARISGGHDRALDEPWGNRTGAPFGEFLQAVHRAGTGGVVDPRLAYQAAAQGAGDAIGSDGGFLVGTSMADRLITRIMTGKVLSRIQPIPLDPGTDSIDINIIDETSRATGSRFGAVQSYWVDEGTAPTATRPKFGRRSLKTRGLATLGYAGNHLLRNASALEAVMTRAFVEDQRWMVENAIIRGTGAGQPQGILTSSSLVSVSKETGQTAATIVKENIDKMWARCHADYWEGAVWLINQDVLPQLDDLQMAVGTGGVPVYLPPGGLSDTPYARLKGRPVVPVEYCSTLGTVGDIILANFDAYLFIQEAQEQASSMHVAFTTNEMAFRVTWYVDGQSQFSTALTPANGTNTLSPFVTLATRA